MGAGLLQSVTALVAACSRRVSRASRRLRSGSRLRSLDCSKIAPSWAPYLSRRISLIPFLGGRKGKEGLRGGERKGRRGKSSDDEEYSSEEEESSEEDGLWRKTILMGDKCQPLDFSGVIYYDSEGRRLPGLPPRSPLRTQLPSFSYPAVDGLFSEKN